MFRRLCLSAVIPLLAAFPIGAQAGQTWAIHGATLIDGTDRRPVENAVIAGRGERVVCAGTTDQCSATAALTVDAHGKFVIPGLINTHVHPEWSNPAVRAQLVEGFASGVTTIRDAATRRGFERNIGYSRASRFPYFASSRIVMSALIEEFASQAETEASIRSAVAAGADAIKIKEPPAGTPWRVIVNEAHRDGVAVWGHTWGPHGSQLPEAIDAGIDGATHMLTFSEFVSPTATTGEDVETWIRLKEKWNAIEAARLRDVTGEMIRRGIWFEPLLVTEKYFTLPLTTESEGIQRVAQLARPWVPYGASSRWAVRARAERIERPYASMCAFVADFHARGGMIVAGADERIDRYALHEEVSLLSECGLGPLAALQAATRDAAIALRHPDMGTIESGQLADLVVLDGNPLIDIANLRRVWRVMKGGRLHDPAAVLAQPAGAQQYRWVPAIRGSAAIVTFALIGAIAFVIARRRVVRPWFENVP